MCESTTFKNAVKPVQIEVLGVYYTDEVEDKASFLKKKDAQKMIS